MIVNRGFLGTLWNRQIHTYAIIGTDVWGIIWGFDFNRQDSLDSLDVYSFGGFLSHRGTPKSSVKKKGISLINHSFGVPPWLWKPPFFMREKVITTLAHPRPQPPFEQPVLHSVSPLTEVESESRKRWDMGYEIYSSWIYQNLNWVNQIPIGNIYIYIYCWDMGYTPVWWYHLNDFPSDFPSKPLAGAGHPAEVRLGAETRLLLLKFDDGGFQTLPEAPRNMGSSSGSFFGLEQWRRGF